MGREERVRENKMKKQLRYSLLAILALTVTIGLVFAQPTPIGLDKQPQPFESNPSAWARISTQMYVVSPTNSYDTMLDFQAQIRPAATTVLSGIWYEVSGFATPFPEPFTPGWIDLKIRYDIPMGGDDSYRIEYRVAPDTTWYAIQPDTIDPFTTAIRPLAQIPEPNDGVWDWTDVSSIIVRVTYTKVGSYNTAQMTMNIWEIWATVYPDPLPPDHEDLPAGGQLGPPAVSVQPPVVMGVSPNPGMMWTDNIFFVDVYVQAVTELAGYEFTMQYDNAKLAYVDSWGYWPWVDFLVTDDPAAGQTNVVGTAEPPIVDVGFAGNSPMARLYFAVLDSGMSTLDLIVSKLGKPGGIPIAHGVIGGFVSTPRYLSLTIGIFPGGDPTGTTWHEDYPTYSTTWTVTAWIDNGDFDLTASDQVDMDDGSGTIRSFHVDQVTITIYWTFKDTYVGEAAAEPQDPYMTELPGDPLWTTWHQIYPDYCRTFIIESWIDNGNGYFDPSDQFDFTYDDTFENVNAHLDAVTTNILVSEKPGPPVPEFPLGIGLLMAIVPMIPIIYIWRLRKKSR